MKKRILVPLTFILIVSLAILLGRESDTTTASLSGRISSIEKGHKSFALLTPEGKTHKFIIDKSTEVLKLGHETSVYGLTADIEAKVKYRTSGKTHVAKTVELLPSPSRPPSKKRPKN